jgi:hypothetical protein
MERLAAPSAVTGTVGLSVVVGSILIAPLTIWCSYPSLRTSVVDIANIAGDSLARVTSAVKVSRGRTRTTRS